MLLIIMSAKVRIKSYRFAREFFHLCINNVHGCNYPAGVIVFNMDRNKYRRS